nr:hypothetical protein [uncultured Sphingomonas sp.]
MSIYRRDSVNPEWEPAPWPMRAKIADAQERGFHERAMKAIAWRAVPWETFPSEGIFGHDKAWFASADVEFVATFDGENLLLIDNVWFGYPDPPRYGLASRPTGRSNVKWKRWGHFAELPKIWNFPDEP